MDAFYLKIVFPYILVSLLGILIGNFTTTVFYRIPRNIMICGIDKETNRPPFCSICGHLLKFYEYLPVLSWFSTYGKCNYCNSIIPKSYLILEISQGIIALILYYFFGKNLEYFFIYFCLCSLVLVNMFIYYEHNFIPLTITLSIIILGMIFRTFKDNEIFSWLSTLSIAFIFSLWLMRGDHKTNLPHIIIPASLWFNDQIFLILVMCCAIVYFTKKYNTK